MKTVKIKDYYGIYQEVPVSDEVYEEWCDLHREEDRLNKRNEAHCVNEAFEDMENVLSVGSRDTMIDEIIHDEQFLKLLECIRKLTPLQQRRVYMLLSGMSYTGIAKAEGRKFAPVYRTLQASFKHLQRLLEDA